MENKSFFQELTDYRVKVERNGKEIVNIPGILCVPGLLAAPKIGLAGLVAAPLLGCSIRMEGQDGRDVNLGKTVRKTAETVAGKAAAAAKTVKEEIEKAWHDMSDGDEAGTGENAGEEAGEAAREDAADQVIVEEPAKKEDVPEETPEETPAGPEQSDDSAQP